MFKYEKTLEYPVNVRKKDIKMAKQLITQVVGSDGELGASLRYLMQRFTMPDDKGKALLSDIGTEELGHVEMICTMVSQLLKDASIEELTDKLLEIKVNFTTINEISQDIKITYDAIQDSMYEFNKLAKILKLDTPSLFTITNEEITQTASNQGMREKEINTIINKHAQALEKINSHYNNIGIEKDEFEQIYESLL